MQITITHTISLAIGEGYPRAVQHLLLTPQSSSVQNVREWRIDAPGMDGATGFIDAYGNRAHLSSQTKPDAEMTITASGLVETFDRNGVVGRLDRDPVPALFRRVTPLTKPVGAVVSKFRAPKAGNDRIALLHGLMARVAEVLGGEGQGQSQSQDGQSQTQSQAPASEAMAVDYAHAFVGAARALEIPARFVSGYLAADGDEGAAFHAWAEAWDDGLGWIGFDAMLGLCPTERHVRVASGLDAVSTAAVRSVPMVGSPTLVAIQVEAAQ
jgi:transglutaminase-like putative cysteine protease